MAEAIRILFHAPTAAALERARRSAVNVKDTHPQAEILIVVNAEVRRRHWSGTTMRPTR